MICGGAVWGWAAARGQRKAAEEAGEALRAVGALRRAMCERKRGLAQALTGTGYAPFAEAGRAMAEGGMDPAAAWEAVRGDMCPRCLDGLFQELGRGTMEDQRAALDEAEARLREERDRAKKRREETGRLYPALGALSGLAAAILLY